MAGEHEQDTDREPVQLPEQDEAPKAESSTADAEAPVGAEGEQEHTDDDSGEQAPDKPRGGFQRRISELTRRAREAERALEAEREARIRAEERARIEGRAPSDHSDPPEPKREQFEDWDQYVTAKAEWSAERKVRAALREADEARTKAEREREAQDVQRDFEKRMSKARQAMPQIDEYVDEIGPLLTPHIAQAIKASEKAPELVAHLARNPDALDRILSMSAVRSVYELGRLEAKLTAPPKRSNAPEPAAPGRARAAPANPLRDDAPMSDWIKARNAEVYGKRA